MNTETNPEQEALDFAKVVVKRRWLLLLVLGVALAVGAVFAFLSPKVFIVDLLIEVGTYPGFEGALAPLENPSQLTEKIASGSYDSAIRAALDIPEGKSVMVKSDNPDSTNLVRAYIHSSHPEEALPILAEVADLVIADHAIRAKARAADTLSGFVPTSIAKVPTVGTKPLNDKPVLTMVFAAFVGGIFALLAAFGKEWWRRSLES